MCSPTIVAHALRQAEETLFRVHAYFFVRDSLHFKNLLAVSEEGVVATEKEVVRLDNDVRSIDEIPDHLVSSVRHYSVLHIRLETTK
jgi:hypothetical protein